MSSLAGAALILADVADEHVRMPAGVLMAGTTIGLFAGYVLVRDRDFSRADANVVGQGMSAGSFLGAGTAMLLGGGERTAAVLGLAGSVAGFWLTYATYASHAREAAESGFRLSLHPGGLLIKHSGTAVHPPQAVRSPRPAGGGEDRGQAWGRRAEVAST